MVSGARFKIRNVTLDGAWSPFSDGGFDCAAGHVLEVQLEAIHGELAAVLAAVRAQG